MSKPFDLAGRRVYVAGHGGMVGSALMRRLAREDCEILTAPRSLDLTEQAATRSWFERERPDVVFLAAAKVGGIAANLSQPVAFLYDNLMISANVIDAAARCGARKLINLGSSCVYPREAPQPITSDALLTGPLEPTNRWYALAKIAGILLAEAHAYESGANFISVMPCNLYGPGDNFDLETSHVLPALMRKAHEAKQAKADRLDVWGSGRPLREFLHVDDMAAASVHVMELDDSVYQANTSPMLSHINVGTGVDCTIRELAETVQRVIGFEGELTFDASKPDGTPRKLMDVSRLKALGWEASITLEEGLNDAYGWFIENQDRFRG